MALKLYDLSGRDERLRFSPFCWRVRMALAHKELEFTTVAWRFLDKQALEFADYDKVPVLCDGEQVVTDSFAIMRYLDKTYPESPVLGEGVSYQRVLLFKYFVERSVNPAIFRTIATDLLAAVHPDDRGYFRETREARFGCTLEEFEQPEQGKKQLHKVLAPVRAILEDTPFLDGDAPAGSDYLLFGSMMWAHVVSTQEIVEPGDPVDKWFKRMLNAHDGAASQALTVRDL
ncbi:glutathione S-transferase N-terminal domain-containing protein [Halovibrio sp. HP20-50]|uniref:glutathione S-transferase N-terminal domain-containing protein n=1 Tax=Halovibrio sp. HP20-59 TaxID=3080275 RepID=UPI00294B22BF|nr:glutathione S-transferase N-terminal domain-containing protein [Halovibrio sp. HP20-59]MEA2116975.1 glutathione S-transferase N-terminal domain-containing protein [Halovibrio sp. HP20-59]